MLLVRPEGASYSLVPKLCLGIGKFGFINAGSNSVTVNDGGRITGGLNGLVASTGAVGTLTLTTPLLDLSGTYLVDLDAATADRLTLFGNLNLGALTDTISFNIINAPTAASYTLISYTGARFDEFSVVSGLPAGYLLDYTELGAVKLVAVVPEPGTWVGAALALAALGWTQRRRLRPKS